MDTLKKSLEEIETATETIRKSRKAKKSEPLPEDVVDNPPDAPKGDAGDDVPAKPTQPPAGENPEDSEAPEGKEGVKMKKGDGCEANGDVSKIKKSDDDTEAGIRKSFTDDPDIAESLKSGAFAASIVDVLVKSLAIQSKKIDEVAQTVTKLAGINADFAKSVVSDFSAGSDDVTERLNEIDKSFKDGLAEIKTALSELAPAAPMRKSVSGIAVQDRDFHASVEGVPAQAASGATNIDAMPKRQVLEMMTKSLMSGESSPINTMDIIGFESGSPLRSEVKSYLESMPSK